LVFSYEKTKTNNPEKKNEKKNEPGWRGEAGRSQPDPLPRRGGGYASPHLPGEGRLAAASRTPSPDGEGDTPGKWEIPRALFYSK